MPAHGYAQNLLWCDPFERFCVVSFVWAPKANTPVHDHEMWGLVGMLRGSETSLAFTRHPETGVLVPGALTQLEPGEVEVLVPAPRESQAGDIHQVTERVRRSRLDQHSRLWRQYRCGASSHVST